MKLKQLLSLLLALIMAVSVVSVFASCRIGGEDEPETTAPSQSNNNNNNNNHNNNNNNNNNNPNPGGNGGGGNNGGSSTPVEKNPWLNRYYRFSEESFTLAPGEKDGILAYLMGLGAIAPDETDEEKINEVLNSLGMAHRHEVRFLTANTVKIISADYTYEADYLYRFDVYKNVMLYELTDTAMKNKLDGPAYTLSLDGKSLTLKVPFSYTTVDGEGNSSTVNCKSYSTLTFTRNEELKLDAVPAVASKSYELTNYAYRFATPEAKEAFESEKGMTVDAWLATENAGITEQNSGILRMESKGKLILEKVVGNGIVISEASYYVTLAAGGAVTLYNTEKGRDEQDENDAVHDRTVFFTVDGATAVVAEGTDVQRLRVYAFETDVQPEVIPGVSGKVYTLSEYSFRFASDEDRIALETEKGMELEAIVAALNATVTENHYKTLAVTDGGKVTCETVTESGSVIADFTYYAIVGEDGVMTLYKTAAGRDNADAGELVTDVAVTVTAQGVEVATPIAAGSSSMQIEVYRFDRDFEEESVSDPKGNVYLLAEYGYKFATDTDIALLENATGKTVSILLAELNTTITEATRRTLTVDQSGRFLCEVVTEGGVTFTVFSYYGVMGDDGVVTLYETAEGRDNADESALVTDVAITVTAKGIEVAVAVPEAPESMQIGIYTFDQAIEQDSFNSVSGNSYLLYGYNYRFDSVEAMEAFEEAMGKTVAEVLAEEKAAITSTNGKRVEFENGGSMRLYQVFDRYTVRVLYGYYDIAEDGTVTLYTLPLDREDKTLVDTDLVIRITSGGVEIAEPFEGGWHIELYQYEKSAPVYNGVPTVAGNCFVSTSDNEIWYVSEKEKDYFDKLGMTQSFILDIISQKRSVYLDSYGRIYAMSANGDVEWLYYFTVNDDGSITRYKTEDGRDSGLASDVVKDSKYFFVSPDGSKLEFRQKIDSGYGTLAVIHLNFKENVQEETPELTDKVYLSDASTPLIWVFGENGVLTAFQNNALLYTYYAKITAGKVSFYTDPDARDMGDANYLVSSLGADLLRNGSVLLLSDGTTLHYNDVYTKAKTPTLYFNSNTQTEYIEVYNLSIDLSGDVITNSDGTQIFQWFEGKGMYKSPITSAPKSEGEYTLRVTTAPTTDYRSASTDIVITVITYEEFTEDCIKVTLGNTVTLRKGQKYIVDVVIPAGQHLMFLDGATDNTKIYRFNFRADDPDYIGLDELILEEDLSYMGEVHDYVCADDRPVVFYDEQFIGKTYRVVWTALENCTVELGTYRIY